MFTESALIANTVFICEMTGARGEAAFPLFGQFEPMIERVTHQVHQRVAQQFDHGAINFRVLSADDEAYIFVERVRKIAH